MSSFYDPTTLVLVYVYCLTIYFFIASTTKGLARGILATDRGIVE